MLFINQDHYLYRRWHLLGISAYYTGFIELGKNACQKAAENAPTPADRELDLANLQFYLDSQKTTEG